MEHTVRSGQVRRLEKIIKSAGTSPVTVTWGWNNETAGLVEWTFENKSSEQVSVILLRNNYYFGNAFWPVYYSNPVFNTVFVTTPTPLVDNGVGNNAPPLAVIDFGGGQRIVAFLFTLAAGQTWSMLEGGFSSAFPPQFQQAPVVTLENTGLTCIGYDTQQVLDWNAQTGDNLSAYSPNPTTFSVATMKSSASFIELYNDSITPGACTGSSGGLPSPCLAEIEQGLQAIAAGDVNGIAQIEDGIVCLITSFNLPLSKLFTRSLKDRIEKIF